jgi:anti-sigma regulatory factor (Ser/Thr protein kinase)
LSDIEVVLRSDTSFLGVVRDMARRAAETVGFAAAPAEEIALAVDECATNVIEHAYGGKQDREYRVRFNCGEGRIVIEVVDDGAGLDAGSLPAVDLKRYAHERRNGGLGVHLMAKLMDSVTYSKEGRFNVCRLERSLQSVKHPG